MTSAAKFYFTVDRNMFPAKDHPLIPRDVPLLLPASSFAHRRRRKDPAYRRTQLRVPNLPPLDEIAIDCGGFVATLLVGQYRYTPAQLVAWCAALQPRPAWVAMMDRCCENELTGGRPGIVALRQAWTTRMAWHTWRRYRDVPWVWVPTIQGWELEDYIRHARALAPLIAEMGAYYGPRSAFRIGIGTLCRRASSAEIRAIVHALAREVGGPFHLWGIKRGAFGGGIAMPPEVVSMDSAAWKSFYSTNERNARGETQTAYAWKVELPQYQAGLLADHFRPKQYALPL